MSPILSESEIDSLLSDPKPITEQQRGRLKKPQKKRGSDLCARIRFKDSRNRKYEIIARHGTDRPNSFSVGLFYRPNKAKHIVLIRCNGWHGRHRNILELKAKAGIAMVPDDTCHIHRITERYQAFGKADGYAEPTTAYDSFEAAVEYLCFSFGCHDPSERYESRFPLWKE
jgi:hypothetical protein